jgi:hypothetical protein
VKKTVLTLAAGVLLGYELAPQVAKVPFISKLPQI